MGNNQLEVFLTYNTATDRASSTMDINIETFSNNPDIPGTAHIIE
jgi:secreted Zn-dependent insulinase-like peptidase